MLKWLAIASLLATAVACDVPLPGVGTIPYSDKVVQIDAMPAGDFTKATDTAFEEGDALSIFGFKGGNLTDSATPEDLLSMQLWLDNGKFTKNQGAFLSDQTYYWYEGEESGLLVGLYPHNATYNSAEVLAGGVDFCVKSDQRTHANYTASDLMGAVKVGVVPTTEKVTLEFNHLLSKVVIDIDNQTSIALDEVLLSDVKGNLLWSVTTEAVADGGKGAINAGELAEPTEGYTNSFVAIIPPQSALPQIAITTQDDKQYTFVAPYDIEFHSGKERHLAVTITDNSIATDFDAIVNDWSADEDVEFKDQPGTGGGDTGGEDDGVVMSINPEWEVEYIPEYVDEEGNYYTNLLSVSAADNNSFYIELYSLNDWNNLVLPNLKEYVGDVAQSLVDFITEYNATNGTDYDLTAMRNFYTAPYQTLYLLNLDPGEYVFAMLGITPEGKVSGHYAFETFEIEKGEQVDAYEAWLGSWIVSGGVNNFQTGEIEENSFNITLSENIYGESYYMEGWSGVSMPVVVNFDESQNALVFVGQTAYAGYDFGDSVADIYFAGISNTTIYVNSEVAKAILDSENFGTIMPIAYSNDDGTLDEIIELAYIGAFEDGSLGYVTSYAPMLPLTITRAETPASVMAIDKGGLSRYIKPFSKREKSQPSGLFVAGECRFNFMDI